MDRQRHLLHKQGWSAIVTAAQLRKANGQFIGSSIPFGVLTGNHARESPESPCLSGPMSTPHANFSLVAFLWHACRNDKDAVVMPNYPMLWTVAAKTPLHPVWLAVTIIGCR